MQVSVKTTRTLHVELQMSEDEAIALKDILRYEASAVVSDAASNVRVSIATALGKALNK